LQEVRDSILVLAQEKQQTIATLDGTAHTATADRVLLRHALLNIVDNAVRYAPPGTTITLASDLHDSEVVLTVSDRGPGIAPEHQIQIFERFYRVDKARARADGGHGLGLAIAKWAVEAQAGRIEVDSEVGRGSTFRIVLRSETRS